MKHLNNLVLEFARRINSHSMNGLDESHNEFLVRDLNKKYSVTLRNTDSSADNASDEQSIDQEQMMYQIESIALDFVSYEHSSNTQKDSFAFEHFQQELKNCFAMHFKINSKHSNASDGQLHSDEELISEIEDIALYLSARVNDKLTPSCIRRTDSFNIFQQELKSLFQTQRNTVSTAIKQQDDTLIDEGELGHKIESIIYQSDYFDLSVTKPDVKRLLELFKTYQNSNPRPVNDSDEQSIIK